MVDSAKAYLAGLASSSMRRQGWATTYTTTDMVTMINDSKGVYNVKITCVSSHSGSVSTKSSAKKTNAVHWLQV